MSDGFVYLGLQQNLDFAGRNLPLLYVATSLVYMLLAIPAGRLADRIGRAKVFVGGYLLLLVVYAALMVPGIGPGGFAGRDRRLRRLLRGDRRRARRRSRARCSRPRRAATGLVGARHGDEPRAARRVDRVRSDCGCSIGVDAAVAVFAVGLVLAAIVAATVLHRYGGRSRPLR